MNPNLTGSFGAAISPGAGSAIAQAMARRGMGASPTTAQSSISQIPTPAPIPQTNPQISSQTPSMGSNPASVVGLPPQTSEAQIIIRALNDRLKTISKIEETQGIPQAPQVTGGI